MTEPVVCIVPMVTPVNNISMTFTMTYIVNQDLGCHTRSVASLGCYPESNLSIPTLQKIAQEFDIGDAQLEKSPYTTPFRQLWNRRNKQFTGFVSDALYKELYSRVMLQGMTVFMSDRLARAEMSVAEPITISKFAGWVLKNTTCPCIATPPRFNPRYLLGEMPTIVQSFVFLVPYVREHVPFAAMDKGFTAHFEDIRGIKDDMTAFMDNRSKLIPNTDTEYGFKDVPKAIQRIAWGESEELFGEYERKSQIKNSDGGWRF